MVQATLFKAKVGVKEISCTK